MKGRTISMEEQKQIVFEILKYLFRICNERGLRIYLAYGTLLGAVRHKGFIPWDDDIDVWMPRKDYEILLKEFPQHPYYKLYHLSNSESYGKIFATLNDIRTYKEEYLIRKKFRQSLCLNIDIFTYDNCPEGKEERNIFIKRCKDFEIKLQCLTWIYSKGKTLKKSILKNLGITYMRMLELIGFTSLPSFMKKYDAYIKQYNDTDTTYCCPNGFPRILKNADFQDSVKCIFEGEEFDIPAGYDSILEIIYGDYMKLPPEEERHPIHSCKCYWR